MCIQARNLVLALEQLPWRNRTAMGDGPRTIERSLLSMALDAPIGAARVRVLLLNALRSGDDQRFRVSAVDRFLRYRWWGVASTPSVCGRRSTKNLAAYLRRRRARDRERARARVKM